MVLFRKDKAIFVGCVYVMGTWCCKLWWGLHVDGRLRILQSVLARIQRNSAFLTFAEISDFNL